MSRKQNIRFSWRDINRFLKGSRLLFVFGFVLGMVDAAAQCAVPVFFRFVINSIESDAALFVREQLGWTIGAGVVLLVLFLPAAYFFHVFFFVSVMRFCRNLQVELYRHVQRLSVDFFQRFQVGEINARLNGDIETICGSAGMLSFILVWGPGMIIYSFTMMFLINVELAVIALVMLVLVSTITAWAMPSLKRWNREVRDASGQVSATITEYVGLYGLLKAFSREDHAERRVSRMSDDLLHSRERLTWLQNLFTDFMQTLTRFVAPLAILFVGALWISEGNLRTGDLVAFWGYWLQLGGLATGLVMAFSALMATIASLDRVIAFFRESPMVVDLDQPLDLGEVRGHLEFRDVAFKYPVFGSGEEEGPVLRSIRLTIRAGEKVAIVGPSGAGKTSLLMLAMRFYDPDEGAILLDGIDIRDVKQGDLRSRLGMVMQESLFFAGSIKDNLLLARPDASEKDCWAALEAANAAGFVREFTGGLATELGERGARLSGGQKQRLAIARAFLKDPAILLLDEPTSALDAKSEQHVKEALNRLLKGRTSIIVAHRLSTVVDSDRIVVMEKGQILAVGTHESLQKECPLYAGLCRAQGLA